MFVIVCDLHKIGCKIIFFFWYTQIFCQLFIINWPIYVYKRNIKYKMLYFVYFRLFLYVAYINLSTYKHNLLHSHIILHHKYLIWIVSLHIIFNYWITYIGEQLHHIYVLQCYSLANHIQIIPFPASSKLTHWIA